MISCNRDKHVEVQGVSSKCIEDGLQGCKNDCILSVQGHDP